MCLNNCQLYEAFPLNLLENINGFVDVFSFTFSINFEGIEIKNKCWLSINFCHADMHTKSVRNNNMYLALVLDYLNDVMACSSFFFSSFMLVLDFLYDGMRIWKVIMQGSQLISLILVPIFMFVPTINMHYLYYYLFFWMGGVCVYMAETQSKIMLLFYPVTD